MKEYLQSVTASISATTATDFAMWATAFATIALAVLTWALMRATKLMANATSRPMLVATLEPNEQTINYFDLVIQNAGSGPAFDVEIKFNPTLPKFSEQSSDHMNKFSVLRPNYKIRCGATPFDQIRDTKFEVNLCWKRNPKSRKIDTITYPIDMNSFRNFQQLGADPLINIERHLKRIADRNR